MKFLTATTPLLLLQLSGCTANPLKPPAQPMVPSSSSSSPRPPALVYLLPAKPTTATTNNNNRKPCGGFRPPSPNPECAPDEICINDPFRPGCGMECDAPGICVKKAGGMCGGFAGLRCSDALARCVDDPSDDCDLGDGGADCVGLCVGPP